MKTQPPDTSDDKLFRSLLATPRPKRLLNFKLENIRLYVQGLAFSEIADIDSSGNEYIADIASACLVLENGKRAFSSGNSMATILSWSEFRKLTDETYRTLIEISPMLHSCDYAAWKAKLESGAAHPSNFIITNALGNCLSFTVLPTKVITHDHPEHYFNIPKKELLDCHWMAYWAARSIFKNNVFNENNEEAFVNANRNTLSTAIEKARNETRHDQRK